MCEGFTDFAVARWFSENHLESESLYSIQKLTRILLSFEQIRKKDEEEYFSLHNICIGVFLSSILLRTRIKPVKINYRRLLVVAVFFVEEKSIGRVLRAFGKNIQLSPLLFS